MYSQNNYTPDSQLLSMGTLSTVVKEIQSHTHYNKQKHKKSAKYHKQTATTQPRQNELSRDIRRSILYKGTPYSRWQKNTCDGTKIGRLI